MNSSPTASFLDLLFEGQEGFIYVPSIRKPKPGQRIGLFVQTFFKWPDERNKALAHILIREKLEDVYIAPAMFSDKRISPETFKGTNFLWSEFDGTIPEDPQIQPSIRIQSSGQGHEHWYWRLSEFATDVTLIQEYTKRLAYALGADLSVWDYQNILRPPGTRNHKHTNTTVTVLSQKNEAYDIATFATLPEPPVTDNIEVRIDKLPALPTIVARYTWNEDAIDLLTKSVHDLGQSDRGDRSAAIVRLAYHCVEAGMSNDEVFVVIEDADKRWGKYVDRTDRNKRLFGIITHVRNRLATVGDITHDNKVFYGYKDFMNTDIKMEWVIPGLIPVAGASMIFGPPGLGKSTWSIRMGIALATGAPAFLNWEIRRQLRVGFMSLEMPHEEVKSFFEDMEIPPELEDALQENFKIWPIGYPYPLDVPDQQAEVLKFVDQNALDLLIVDSLGVAMYGDVSNDNDVKRLNSFLNEDLRKARNCGYFLIHHPRKPGASDVKKPKDMYDSFGSTYIINNAQTVFNLNPGPSAGVLDVNIYKSRLTDQESAFRVRRTSNRNFELIEGSQRKDNIKEEIADLTKDTGGRLPFGKAKNG